VADVSFISVTKILPAVLPIAEAGSDFLILIKPQFELRREDIGPGGIVSDAGYINGRLIQCATRRWLAAECDWGESEPAGGAEVIRSFSCMPERRLKCGACVVDESKIAERFLVAAPACSRQARCAPRNDG